MMPANNGLSQNARSAKGPTKIGHIIDASFLSPGAASFGKGFLIYKIWSKAVGHNIAKRARPFKLAGKILYVTTDTSAWMEELKYLKQEIIKKINTDLKSDAVEDIVFRLGRPPEKNPSNPHQPANIPKFKRQLTKKELDDVDRLVSPIKDDELRDIVRKAVIRSINTR